MGHNQMAKVFQRLFSITLIC